MRRFPPNKLKKITLYSNLTSNNYEIILSNRHLYDICLTYEDDIESEQSGHRVGSEFSTGRKSA